MIVYFGFNFLSILLTHMTFDTYQGIIFLNFPHTMMSECDSETSVVCHCVNRIGGVMISGLTLSVVDCGFEPPLGQTKDYKIGICYFYAKHIALKGERAKTGWLRIRIMCLSGTTCLSTDCVSMS
jgi:hypothetical protein